MVGICTKEKIVTINGGFNWIGGGSSNIGAGCSDSGGIKQEGWEGINKV